MNKINNISSGLGLGIGGILFGAFLIYDPTFLGIVILSNVIGIISIFIGIIGFGIEMNNLNESNGWDEFSLGIGFLFIWWVYYISINIIIFNWLSLIILLLGLGMALSGICKNIIMFKLDNFKRVLATLIIILSQIGTIIFTLKNINIY